MRLSPEQILERGEKIDILVEQTDTLNSQSLHFKKSTRKLEWAILLKNIKLLILVAIVLIVRCKPPLHNNRHLRRRRRRLLTPSNVATVVRNLWSLHDLRPRLVWFDPLLRLVQPRNRDHASL